MTSTLPCTLNRLCGKSPAISRWICKCLKRQMLRTFQVEIAKLKMMPQRIPLTPEEPWHSVGIRRMLVKNYNIYFWIDDEKSIVQITDVIYGRRNQPKQLMDMPME